jgi:hypothetical protein
MFYFQARNSELEVGDRGFGATAVELRAAAVVNRRWQLPRRAC